MSVKTNDVCSTPSGSSNLLPPTVDWPCPISCCPFCLSRQVVIGRISRMAGNSERVVMTSIVCRFRFEFSGGLGDMTTAPEG